MKTVDTHEFEYPNGQACKAIISSPSGTMNHPISVHFQSPTGDSLIMDLKGYNEALPVFWKQCIDGEWPWGADLTPAKDEVG